MRIVAYFLILIAVCASATSCSIELKNGQELNSGKTGDIDFASDVTETLTSPPELVIANSLHEMTAGHYGFYWEYYNEKGERIGETADSAHPLDCRENLPIFNIYYTYQSRIDPKTAYLMFETLPDKVTVTRWSDDVGKNRYDGGEAVEVSITADGYKAIDLCDSSIYMVYAEWNTSDKYCGNAIYAFCTNLVEPIIISDLE